MVSARIRDGAFAAALTALSIGEIVPHGLGGARAPLLVLTCLGCLGVGVRRRFPEAAFALAVVGFVSVLAIDQVDVESMLFVIALTGFTLGDRSGDRTVVALGSVAVVADFVAVAVSSENDFGSFLFTGIVVVVPVLAGRTFHDLARRGERDREEEARRAVDEERARIARELHDIVGHGVSLMVLQAGAGQRVTPEDAGEAGEAFAVIERVGRSSLQDLQRMLGVLRGVPNGALEPQPGLGDLTRLVDDARVSGAQIEFTAQDLDRDVEPGVSLAGYRIVQEALTNAARHAPGAPVRVAAVVDAGAVRLEIADGGTQRRNGHASAGGHGLVGMRERVRLYDGELSAGPAASGGWTVRAVLPL